jgi:eukaryotic-like serine/threonine-protein kinase
VHRDISPQNIIVGVDGVARVLDFGVAKAAMRSHATKEGEIKGKLAYMAPEQLKSLPLDRRVDLFAAGVVLWECLTGQRLFRGDDLGQTIARVLHSKVTPPSALNSAVPPELDAVVLRALERDPGQRFQTAREQAAALGAAVALASPSQVADWVRELGGARLSQRIERVAAIESRSSSRLKVTGRSPLHTPLGLMAVSVPTPGGSLGSGEGRSKPAELACARDDVPTVRPARDEPSSSSVGSRALESRPATSRRAKLMLVAVAAVALAAGVAISWLTRAPASSARLASPLAVPVASLAVPIVSVPPVEVSFDLPPVEPSAAAPRATAGKPAAARSAARVGAAKTGPAVSKTGAKPAINCSPPCVVDERGIRRIKPECR